MIYGVKVIHTYAVGEAEKRIYEEIILSVNASSFDEAYEKAGRYMQDCACDYVNTEGERVRTVNIEAVNCFQAFEPEGDVQEIYSAFKRNDTTLTEEEYYEALASDCEIDKQ